MAENSNPTIPTEDTSTPNDQGKITSGYEWMKYYETIANKIYKDDNFIENALKTLAGKELLTPSFFNVSGQIRANVDPFSFFALLNIDDKKRIDILKVLFSSDSGLELHTDTLSNSSIPRQFLGIPAVYAGHVDFPAKSKAFEELLTRAKQKHGVRSTKEDKEKVNTANAEAKKQFDENQRQNLVGELKKLFTAAMEYAYPALKPKDSQENPTDKFIAAYQQVKGFYSDGWLTTTSILFEMAPNTFLPLDSNTREYLLGDLDKNDGKVSIKWPSDDDESGAGADGKTEGKENQKRVTGKSSNKQSTYADVLKKGTAPTAEQYLAILNYVGDKLDGKGKPKEVVFEGIHTFAELSYEAWRTSSFAQAFELLESNHQVILTGAPGTGKTHTAKQVANAFVDENKSFKRFTTLIPDFDEADVDKKAALKKFFQACLDLDFVEKLPDYDPDNPDKWQEKLFTARVQFHPGYDYSDFVIGMKPILIDLGSGKPVVKENGNLVIKGTSESPKGAIEASFIWEDGAFKKFADRARTVYDEWCKQKDNDPKEAPRFVFIIDEINRADLSRVFGELFSLLEESYRYSIKKDGDEGDEGSDENSITLPNGDEFVIPENLYIIGTMNDIDRSVESMDFALRRCFAWLEVTAEQSECILDDWAEKENVDSDIVEKLKKAMEALNKKIREDKDLKLGPEYELGGAYFKKFGDGKTEDRKESYERLWDNHLRIILSEYLRGNHDRVTLLDKLHQVYIEGCGYGKKMTATPDAGEEE